MSDPSGGSGRGPSNGPAALAFGIASVAVVAIAHQDVIPVLVMPVLVSFFVLATDRWAAEQRVKPRWGLLQPSLSWSIRRPFARRRASRGLVGILASDHGSLLTATGCLLAFGVVMNWSASHSGLPGANAEALLLKSALACGAGLIALYGLSQQGIALLQRYTPALVIGSFALLTLVLVPGLGGEVEGARRWLGIGGLRIEPAKLMTLALIGYTARFLAAHPNRVQTFRGMVSPLIMVTGAAVLLIAVEPDVGAAVVLCLSIAAMLVVGGTPLRFLGYLLIVVVLEMALLLLIYPPNQGYLAAFLDPWVHSPASGVQAIQSQLAFGTGGLFGTGLDNPTHTLRHLPETNTTFMLALIAEELGLVGVMGVFVLFGLLVLSGLRIARAATDVYAKLLASGLVSLIMTKALVNAFVALGLAPVVGVPLPLVSYGPSDAVVTLMAIGLILNVGRDRKLRLVS